MPEEVNVKNILGHMPVATVIQLLVAVFALGGIWVRFQSVEDKQKVIQLEIDIIQEKMASQIDEIERNKASTHELTVTHNRLSKYTDRFNEYVEQSKKEQDIIWKEIYQLKYKK